MSENSNHQTNKNQQISKALEPKIGNSTYVVNNSLVCCLRPKRASFDIKLYLQLHKKLMRKAIIEKKFEQSAYQFSSPNKSYHQGFKGKKRPETFLCRSTSLRQKQQRVFTEPNTSYHEAADNWSNSYFTPLGKQREQVANIQGLSNNRTKPNMMYNLSLYRKGFKQSSLKRERACLTIMQNLQRTKRQRSQQRSTRRSKIHTTIS